MWFTAIGLDVIDVLDYGLIWGLVPGVALGLSSYSRRASIKQFCVSLLCSALVCWIPFLIFAMSFFLASHSKDGAPLGWINSTGPGRIALFPLLVWAHSAFHVTVVERRGIGEVAWASKGLMNGVAVYTLWFVLDLINVISLQRDVTGNVLGAVLLLLPLLMAIVYLVLVVKWGCWGASSAGDLKATGLWSLPCWVATWFLSELRHGSLPQTSECFVVTSALQGHESVVGPLVFVEHRGQVRAANAQLAFFWELEVRWRLSSPSSHAVFRAIYNRLGPLVARQVQHPLLADLVYLLLKPFEWGARLVYSRLPQP